MKRVRSICCFAVLLALGTLPALIAGSQQATTDGAPTDESQSVIDGVTLRELNGHQRGIFAIACSPDGKWLATSDYNSLVLLWDTATGRIVHKLISSGWVHADHLSFSADSKTLVASGLFFDSTSLWDVATGRKVTSTPDYAQPSQPWEIPHDGLIVFSPDGRTVAKTDRGMLDLYDAQTDKKSASIPLKIGSHSGTPPPMVYSPGSKLVAIGTNTGLLIVDTESRRIKYTLHPGEGTATAAGFSPDGALIAAGGENGDVVVWDVATGNLRYTLTGHRDSIGSLAFDPRGSQLATASNDGVLALWNPQTGKLIRTFLNHRARNRCMAYSPDGRLLFVGGDPSPQVYDTATWQTRHWTAERTDYARAAAYTPDGAAVVLGLDGGDIEVRDVVSRKRVRTWKAGKWVDKLFISPDGKRVTTIGENNRTQYWNLADGKPAQPETVLPRFPEAISSDLRLLAAHNHDYITELWDIKTGQRLHQLDPMQRTPALALSADGRRAATYDPEGNITLWDTAGGQALHVFKEDRDPTLFAPGNFQIFGRDGNVKIEQKRGFALLALSATGSTLAACRSLIVPFSYVAHNSSISGSRQMTELQIWDAASDKPVSTLRSAHAFQRLFTLAPNGRYAAISCDIDRVIVVFDIAERKRYVLTGTTTFVTALTFSPDSKTLLAADQNGLVELWTLP